MTEPDEPRRSGVVPAALLGACLLSIAAVGAALPAGLRLFTLTAGSHATALTAASAALLLAAALGASRGAATDGRRAGSRAGAASRIDLTLAGLALAVALSPVLFMAGRAAYLALWPLMGGKEPAAWVLRLLLATTLFSPPAFFVGRLMRSLSRLAAAESGGASAGFALGLGAGGLALGLLCGGSVLLPSLGMKGVFLASLALGGLGTAGAVLLGRLATSLEADPADEAAGPGADPAGASRTPGWATVGLAALLSGFALGCAFLCWGRTARLILGPTEQTTWVAGAMLLIALALGALLASGGAALQRPQAVVLLMTGAALLFYGSMFIVPWLATFYLRLAPGYATGGLAAILSAVVSGLLMLPAGMVQGASLAGLPALGASGGAVEGGTESRRGLAILPAFLLGAVVAAIATPTWIIPSLGLRRSLSLASAAALLAAALVVRVSSLRSPMLRGTMATAMLGAVVLVVAFPAAWDPRIIGAGLYRYAAIAPERFGSSERYLEGRLRARPPVFYREGTEACVMVEPSVQSAPGEEEIETYALSLDGRSAANDGADLRTQILTGEIPVLLHGPTDNVLLIDFLTGVAAGSILRHPVRSLTVIEREPAVLQAGALFQEVAGNPSADARLRAVADSPRARLLADRTRYDLIVLQATDPWLPHTAALITREGYALLRERLQPHGLLAQRLSLAAMDEGAHRTMMRTFARVFDSVTVFQLTPDDLLLVGSTEPLHLNAGWLSNITSSNAAVAEDLRRAVVLGPNEIVMSLRLGGDALRRLMGDGPLCDDDRSVVQVAATRNLSVHRNIGLVKSIEGAWEGFGPLLDNYGATREEQASFLYGLAKALLGLTADPTRALEVARELAGMGEVNRSRWVTGEALIQRKDVDGALREWEAVLASDPGNLDALFSLGTLYLDTNDFFAAEKYLGEAARRHPDVPIARYHHGRTLFHLGRFGPAISELRKARELAGSTSVYPLADYLLGVSAARLGRNDEAAKALEDYLKWAYAQTVLTRVEVDAHLKLADVLDRQGKRFDALRQRQKADQLRGKIEAYGRLQQEAAAPEAGSVTAPEAPSSVPPAAGSPSEPPEPPPAPTAPPGSPAPGGQAPSSSDGR